jgi:hypothetical protein
MLLSFGGLVVFLVIGVATIVFPRGHGQVPEEPSSLAGAKRTLHMGTFHASTDNAIVSDLEIRGSIVIEAKNVTMKNVRLLSETPWHALRVMDDARGFVLQDSEIDGQGRTVNGVLGFGTFLRNNIHGVDNGMNVTGPSVIRENYMHSFRGTNDSHFDGVEVNGGHDIMIINNKIINRNAQTSAIMLNNYFSGLRDITIEGNILVGGGYTIYLDGRFQGGIVNQESIKILNNEIGGGRWGDFAFFIHKPIVRGNIHKE